MDRTLILRLAALMVTGFTVGTDFTGILLLVPAIEAHFGADITTTQWVLNLYALNFSVFMVCCGRLGDMHGHRTLMLLGASVFLCATLACWISPTIGWLIVARGVQGVGAAMIWPSLIATAANVAGSDEKRGISIGLVLAGVTTGNVVGPLIGGFADTFGDWRLFFVVNAAMAAVAGFMVYQFIPGKEQEKTDEQIDIVGLVVFGSAVLAVLFGLDVGADLGWLSLPIIALFLTSVILFIAFPFIEARVRDPMIPVPMMRNKEFMLAVAANALIMPALFPAFLYFPQVMQKVLGWSVMEASIGMSPLMVLLAVGSIFSGHFYNIFGPKKLLVFGYVIGSLGAAYVVLAPSSWGYFALLPAMLLFGVGASVAVGSSGTAAVGAVVPERAGMVGGLTFTVHLAFGALGVAAATAIVYVTGSSGLNTGLSSAGIELAQSKIDMLNSATPDSAGVREVLASLKPGEANTVRELMISTFHAGVRNAYWLALFWAVVGVFAVLSIDEERLKQAKDFKEPAKTTD
ncbi:MAG: MFS transporter [Pseudomonadota bacterium]